MRFLALPAMLVSVLIAGCTTAAADGPQALDQPPQQQAGNTPPEDLDPFVVMIGAERWTVILGRAMEGAIEAPATNAEIADSDLYRTDAALKSGAAMVVELRNMVCARGLLAGEACKLPPFPAWTHEPPNGSTSLEELDRRSAWLSEVMDPFTAAGCEAGRRATDDYQFCSVE